MSARAIAVVTDSTAYLPPDVRERLDIPVIPLNVLWGEEVLKDGVDIDPPTFYRRLQTAKVMPTTSQPSAGEFVEFFRRVAEEKGANTIVGVFISSQLSGTVASAEAAKDLLSDLHIEVLDSRSTSMGQGFQAMAAAEAAQAGAPLEEVVAAARQVQQNLHILFMVDTLEFLHRGGRIGGGKRFLGTALQIKPLLGLDGVIEGVEQVRTKKKALARMLEILREKAGARQVFRAAVVHANALEDAQALAEEVRAQLRPEELYLAEVSPVIGTHTGPGTLGICIVTR
ncbi:MAG: DegV family protein [Anaerolineae bacterium]|nr:DegV family protein [Anaerolineae bacterium]MDW7991819.1 DegV family protein [Anaerolineae bacterium]MDW8069657.1 DegV family protein [Anaerolineae bacterium]